MRLLALCLSSVLVLSGDLSAEFRAGAAKVDITPTQWPVDMVGSFSRRLADQALAPLHARAVVVADEQTVIAIVTVDSCYVPQPVFDEAKRRIHLACGIEVDRMLMSATHTHTAPPSRDRRQVKADPVYVEQVTDGIAKAVITAHRNLEPAKLGHGVVAIPQHLHNRRWFMRPGGIVANPFGGTDDVVRMNPPRGKGLLDRPAGPIDPDLTVLSLRAKTGRQIAVYANYSLHYVGGIPPKTLSADYFGEFAQLVETETDHNDSDHPPVVALLSNGTSGDVNNINFRDPQPRKKHLEQMRLVAKSVAEQALELADKAEYQSDITLDMAEKRIQIAKRRPNAIQLERARQTLATEDESSLPSRAKHYARWVVALDEPPFQSEVVLQAARIGTAAITAIPCEVFAETGLELKEKSPFRPTLNVSLANGHHGYLPTPRQHEWGGYETWMGTNTLEKQASVIIVRTLEQLLAKIH